MSSKNVFSMLLLAVLFAACSSTQQITYFQDLKPGESETTVTYPSDIRLEPNDKISILVNSRDPLLKELFNLSRPTTSTTSQEKLGYTVDNNGNIDFPVLGPVLVAGKTRAEVAEYIKKELVSKNLVKDPVVIVEFQNLGVSVLGEVKAPGRYAVPKDRLTILEALSMAGDLTINGKRENIKVLRNEDGVQRVYGLNLCSAEDIYTSPAYYLQQNDVVYVEPNRKKAGESTVNANTFRSTSFWISLASLMTSISLIFIK